MAKKRVRFSIRAKTILLIVVFGAVLGETAMVFFTLVSSNANKENYKNMATDLSKTTALVLDGAKVKGLTDKVVEIYDASSKPIREDYEGTQELKDYLALFEPVRQTQEYKDIQQSLYNIKSCNRETDGVYLGWVDYARKLCVYLCYDRETESYPVGVIDRLYEEDYPLIENHNLGFVASIYDSPYDGVVMVTAGTPVYYQSEEPICFAFVDISMEMVRAKQANRIVRLFAYLVITVALLSVVGIIVTHYTIVKPMRTLTNATRLYDASDPEKTHDIFTKLSVSVNDEISDLASGMKEMESDVYDKMRELTLVNEALNAAREETEKMTELASKDALTGVGNKIAYDGEVKLINEKIEDKEAVEFGIAMVDLNYLKKINDEYGHDHGDAALQRLSSLLGEFFPHTPIFRIGGDEFVMILRDEDYHNAESIIDAFDQKIATLENDKSLLPEEQTSAALGFSSFDPATDSCVYDVFRRADAAMYERKRQMKSEDK